MRLAVDFGFGRNERSVIGREIKDYILGICISKMSEVERQQLGAEDERASEIGNEQGMNKKALYKTRSSDSTTKGV